MRRGTVEALKTVLILLLVILAGFLFYATWIYDGGPFALFSAPAPQEDAPPPEIRYGQAVRPAVCAVTNAAGRYAVNYDGRAAGEVYDRASGHLGAALGSAGTPAEIPLDKWREALTGESVFFSFPGDAPLDALAVWLGASASVPLSGARASDVMLFNNGGAVDLYYRDRSSARFFAAATPLPYARLAEDMADFSPNGGLFVFETESAGVADPSMLAVPEPDARAGARMSPPSAIRSKSGIILKAFEFNPNTVYRIAEDDGEVIVDNARSLRIFDDGTVIYKNPSEGGDRDKLAALTGSDGLFASDIIETVRKITEQAADPFCADGETYLYSMRYDFRKDSYTVLFRYRLSSVPVYGGASDYAVLAVVKSGIITDARINLREFELLDALPVRLMPAAQAAAAARFSLITPGYNADGDSILQYGWYAPSGGKGGF